MGSFVRFLTVLAIQVALARGACIPVGSSGCEANNGKCCRKGNPYTGEMRKCVNTGSFSSPVYTCQEAKRKVLPRNLFDVFYKGGGCIALGGAGCEAN